MACKSLRLVTRSSYSTEVLSATGTVDDQFPLLVTLEEIERGPLKAEEIKKLREEGGFQTELEVVVDSLSLLASIAAKTFKAPAEQSLSGHVHYLREALGRIVARYRWADTRDMGADGFTKGSVDRAGLKELMAGVVRFRHESRVFDGHAISVRAATKPFPDA